MRIYREIPPAASEWTLRHLFLRTSLHPVTELRVTGGPGDKGADVVAKTYVDGVGPHKYVIQAKRYGAKRTAGFQDVSQFAGTCATRAAGENLGRMKPPGERVGRIGCVTRYDTERP
ncbi:restriction endonuclease [Streptomyces sp. CA-135486]|uniref:restriction endonuclease n=1 Tax=Streptomyces sp. CA-135486 TaxID=3240049 RepID=UPI003D94DDFC